MHPKIVFIDSPNAVGKDYFIENFLKEYRGRYGLNKNVVVINAKDFLPTFVKDTRHYSNQLTSRHQNVRLFLGHIKLLNYLRETITETDTDLILVNRSFITFLVYNLSIEYEIKRRDSAELSDEDEDLLNEKQEYIDAYQRLFRNLFQSIPTLYVHLSFNEDTVEGITDRVIERMKNRNDGKCIVREWVTYLVESYDKVDQRVLAGFTYKTKLTSDEYKYLLEKYFSSFFRYTYKDNRCSVSYIKRTSI